VFRKMVASNPKLGEQFMTAMRQHKAELLDNFRMTAVWEAQWEKFQQILGELIGIFSLSEDAVHTLMWSHYASQHRGIVVEFDESHPWFDQRLAAADEFRHLVKVNYVQNPIPRTWKQLNGADVLYTKSAIWSYEREWRIIRPLKDAVQIRPGIF